MINCSYLFGGSTKYIAKEKFSQLNIFKHHNYSHKYVHNKRELQIIIRIYAECSVK